MSQRDYNHIYHLGPLCLQVLQDGQHDSIVIDLLPQVTFTANNSRLVAGFGLSWIVGTVNFGWMTAEFRKGEQKRLELVKELAAKAGLTPQQYALRWGW
jgi:hypothetical protein